MEQKKSILNIYLQLTVTRFSMIIFHFSVCKAFYFSVLPSHSSSTSSLWLSLDTWPGFYGHLSRCFSKVVHRYKSSCLRLDSPPNCIRLMGGGVKELFYVFDYRLNFSFSTTSGSSKIPQRNYRLNHYKRKV